RIATITSALQHSLSAQVDVNIGNARDFSDEAGQGFGRDPDGGSHAPQDEDRTTPPSAHPVAEAWIPPSLTGTGGDRLHIRV
ncbi:MAG: hypothetical protein WBF53_15935, partial [Litorimonas sp.]